MQDYVLNISKPGDDVKNTADKDMSYSSAYSAMKVRLSGSTSITGGSYTEVPHNFGYKPRFVVYLAGTGFEDTGYYVQVGENGSSFSVAYTTTSSIFIKAAVSTTAYYFIFSEKAD